MKSVNLKTSLELVDRDFSALITQCRNIDKSTIQNESELTQLDSQITHWQHDVEKVINRHFDDPEGSMLNGFNNAVEDFFDVYYVGMKEDFEDRIREYKRPLHYQENYLKLTLTLLPVLDQVTGNESLIDINQPNIEDIFYLALSKLLDLKDGSYYPLGVILEGNGVTLRRETELWEIAQELNKLGYIKIGQAEDVQITVKGELQLAKWERARKRTQKKKYNNSVDDVIKELKILGLGQEILFEELEELKSFSVNMSKKNWRQMVKGKLVDLTLSKVISSDTAKFIFDKILPGDSITKLLN